MKEHKTGPDSADHGERSGIAEDHQALKTTLNTLENTSDLKALIALLEDLRAHLEGHFSREEAPDGFHELIGDSAPHLLAYLQRLFEEHREILDDLEKLITKSRECFEGPVHEVLCEVSALSHRLQIHESRESALLGDAMYTDLGDSS
jgi:hypothetical protein